MGSAVPIIAHAGERVLTASETGNFHQLVNNAGNRASTITNHFGGHTINGAGNEREIKKVLRNSPRETAEAVKRAMRNGHF